MQRREVTVTELEAEDDPADDPAEIKRRVTDERLAIDEESAAREDTERPDGAVREMRNKLLALRKPDGSSGVELDEVIAYYEQRIVEVAYCPEHGLHGTRSTCFECGKPVKQIPIQAVRDTEQEQSR
jgi:hypothetical protein